MSNYHNPVMLQECIDGLNIDPDGIYVDVTFGGGGHAAAIVEKLEKGKLFGFDQDPDAVSNAKNLDSSKFKLIEANFRYLKKQLRFAGVRQVDGILADLGVSSHQFDEGERGFSTRFDGPLDMRMNQSKGVSAADLVNNYSAEELQRVFGMYGEIKNARTLAEEIQRNRQSGRIETIEQFKEAIARVVPKHREFKYWAKVFQALRMEVNEEMLALEEMLVQCEEVISPKGRLVVMSYHSLEDRLVKNYVRSGNLNGKGEKDFYGNLIRPFEPINRKPLVAQESEIEENGRARSAKLRIAERIDLN